MLIPNLCSITHLRHVCPEHDVTLHAHSQCMQHADAHVSKHAAHAAQHGL